MSEWVKVGKIKDAHGIKGELYVLIFSGDISWQKKLTQVQIGSQVYDVASAKAHKDGLILKVKQLVNRNQSEELKGRFFFIPENLLVSQDGETIFLNEVLGFTVEDANLGEIGTVRGVSSNNAQDLLLIKKGEKEFEIPLVAEFIKEIDYKSKFLKMVLPEGLLEINEKEK